MTTSSCPCRKLHNGTKPDYSDCCQPYHQNKTLPQTAEALMRSRYSAFALQLADYLVETHHPNKRPPNEKLSLLESFKSTEWTGLEVCSSKMGGPKDKEGWVLFQAHCKNNGISDTLTENSYFSKIGERWYYVEGEHSDIKLGRNDPCRCGSGRKFKKCHGK